MSDADCFRKADSAGRVNNPTLMQRWPAVCDGELLIASEERNTDLFRAMRGALVNVWIVTGFRYACACGSRGQVQFEAELCITSARRSIDERRQRPSQGGAPSPTAVTE